MTAEHFMVVIDDLELEESKVIANFLKDAIDNGDLGLAIQDCISIAKEIKFHKFAWSCGTITCGDESNGFRCGKSEFDTVHCLDSVETD